MTPFFAQGQSMTDPIQPISQSGTTEDAAKKHHPPPPTPEPATYGAIFLTLALGLLLWRRFQQRRSSL